MSTEEAKEEGVPQDLDEPAEEIATHSPMLLPPPPIEPEPEPEPQGQGQGQSQSQGQTWLLELLDDVRYLISCTNWY